ncbi:MAG: hypothetical protein ACRDNG_04580 [Gaiellaceae bacterium]
MILGDRGNDVILGKGGNDKLCGEEGRDRIKRRGEAGPLRRRPIERQGPGRLREEEKAGEQEVSDR